MNELALINNNWPTFVEIMSLTAHADKTPQVIHALLVQEVHYMQTAISLTDGLQGCTPESVVNAIRSSVKWNLTLDPSAGLVYLKCRNMNVKDLTTGTSGKKKVMEIARTANGEVSYCRQTGRILDIERPVIEKDEAGKVIGASVRILKPSVPSPRWETVTYDRHDFNKWMAASHKEKARFKEDGNTVNYANPLYFSYNGGPDPEFICAKVIRHALKKLGTNQNETVRPGVVPVGDIVSKEADRAATYDDFVEVTP